MVTYSEKIDVVEQIKSPMASVQKLLNREIENYSISQAELSRRANISRPTINRLVNGKADINPEWAAKLAYVLDLDPKVLYMSEAEEKIDEAVSKVDLSQLTRADKD